MFPLYAAAILSFLLPKFLLPILSTASTDPVTCIPVPPLSSYGYPATTAALKSLWSLHPTSHSFPDSDVRLRQTAFQRSDSK